MFESMFSFPGAFSGDFQRLREEFDELFGGYGATSGIRSVAPGSFPALNVGNTPRSLEIYAFAPGIDSSKVDVTIDRGVLTIAGERPSVLPSANDRKVSVYSRERVSGRFQRAVSLPEDADPAQVQATYRDGVLHISVARRDAPVPTRIAIQ